MKERPILFSGAMVRAILEGRKTQTRRIVKQQLTPLSDESGMYSFDHKGLNYRTSSRISTVGAFEQLKQFCLYGQPGDQLWVRESIEVVHHGSITTSKYCADGALTKADTWPWQRDRLPSIHCPRGLSRITLKIVSVRVERLQDISEKDAKAEGLKGITKDGKLVKYGIPDADGYPGTDDIGWPWDEWYINPVAAYRNLWESINGQGSWGINPWVWVVEFKQVN